MKYLPPTASSAQVPGWHTKYLPPTHNSLSEVLWQQRCCCVCARVKLLLLLTGWCVVANGWPWAPFRGAKPQQLPPSLGITSLLHMKTTLSIKKVGLQYYVVRKGYEFMIAGFEAGGTGTRTGSRGSSNIISSSNNRWRSCSSHSRQATLCSVTGCAPLRTSGTLDENLPNVQQQQQQQSALAGGRQLQRLVDKLAQHSWELTYSGYTAALAARCDELAQQLRTAWQQQQQQQQGLLQQGIGGTGNSTGVPVTQLVAAVVVKDSGSSAQTTTAAAVALPAAVLADCAGGILSDIESVSGGLGAKELLSGKPELLLAATRRGPRPDASIDLWFHLLPAWEHCRRWLDLVTARCGLLGARVAAARQLAEPSSRGPPMPLCCRTCATRVCCCSGGMCCWRMD